MYLEGIVILETVCTTPQFPKNRNREFQLCVTQSEPFWSRITFQGSHIFTNERDEIYKHVDAKSVVKNHYRYPLGSFKVNKYAFCSNTTCVNDAPDRHLTKRNAW